MQIAETQRVAVQKHTLTKQEILLLGTKRLIRSMTKLELRSGNFFEDCYCTSFDQRFHAFFSLAHALKLWNCNKYI